MDRPIEAVPVFADIIRTTRVRLRWSQRELGRRSGISQGRISTIESRKADDLRLSEVEALCATLHVEYRIDFRTPDVVRRPSDIVHARCSGHVDRRLRGLNWQIAREVEVSSGRIRGWIDLLAFDKRTGTLVIVEIKTELVDLGALERTVGWYERCAIPAAAALGWEVRRLATALLVLHATANDRAIESNRLAIRSAFPNDAVALSSVFERATPAGGRYISMIDPASTARRWLRPTRLVGSRLRAPYEDYVDAVRRLEHGRA